jgi:hypothetical protein
VWRYREVPCSLPTGRIPDRSVERQGPPAHFLVEPLRLIQVNEPAILPNVKSIEYLFYLAASQEDRLRVRALREKRDIVAFSVQYEALIRGQWVVIVRYDTAHGFAHRDLMRAGGRVQKTPLPWMTYNVALTYATQELKTNWKRYRQTYEALEDAP